MSGPHRREHCFLMQSGTRCRMSLHSVVTNSRFRTKARFRLILIPWWLSFGEYLYRHFLGRSVCSLSMASGTGMLQTRAHAWDTELMNVLDVRSEQFPPLGDLHERVQGLTPMYASAWPALHTIPWFPALGDGAAACIGSGCVSMENWSVTIGTSSAIRVVVPPEQVVPPLGLWLYLIDAKRAVLGGALSEGTTCSGGTTTR